MAAGKYSFIIEQGSTFTRTFKYKDANGDPFDLTGYDVRMQIRSSHSSLTPIDTFDNGGEGGFELSIPVSGSVKNQITLTITATQTAAFTFDQALYDIEIESGSIVTRLLQGKIKLSPEITK
ncbi:MAG: hypothetical protein HN564_02605 [Flavobacteriales bacterium]|jgi:hypothetical protein|nr:hypothetical protein [Flavobacteriales bacterium]